jgi:hypothetical protein
VVPSLMVRDSCAQGLWLDLIFMGRMSMNLPEDVLSIWSKDARLLEEGILYLKINKYNLNQLRGALYH